MSKAEDLTKRRNIKNYSLYLNVFLVINTIIFLWFVKQDFNFKLFNENLYKYSIVIVCSLITFILNGLLPSDFKAILVFWKKENPYPGYRAFTDFLNKESYRIDKSVLIEKYGELPTQHQEQNKLWYKMYKKNEFDPMIFDSHRNFLLSRDLTGLSFVFLCIYSISALISKILFKINFKLLLIYIIFLLLQYLVLSKVSQNYGNRFVCNVLAKESADLK